MKRFLTMMLAIVGLALCADDIPAIFNKALVAYDRDYILQREQILAADITALKSFLREKAANSKSSILEKALAYVLLEHVEKKAAIDNLIYAGRVREPDKDFEQSIIWEDSVFRYPYQWDKLPAEKRALIMDDYSKNECLFFILESLWKFTDSNARFPAFQDIKGFNLPVFVFFGIARGLQPELKELFVATLKDSAPKHFSPLFAVDSFEYLLYLEAEDSCHIILDWGNKRITHPDAYVYKALCIILPAMQGADLKVLKSAQIILEKDDVTPRQVNATNRELLDGLIQFYERGEQPDDKWISSYLVNAQSVHFMSFILIQPFLLKLRPDIEKRLQEIMVDKNESLDPFRKKIPSGIKIGTGKFMLLPENKAESY